jgi:branched-chain amino acid transport system ATP-binding protein
MTDGLVVADLRAGYGETVVLDQIGFTVSSGDTLALLGRNGVGKSTLLQTLMGHTTVHGGSVSWAGADITRWPAYRRSRHGMAIVPQEREIFPSLTVAENLTVAARGARWTIERVYDLFPQLANRRRNRGNQLSGGEQQMLSVGRALMCDPMLLLLDEPLEGLAPVIVDALLAAFERLKREDSLTIVLVEQHARLALEFATQALALDRGRIVYYGASAVLANDLQRLSALLGVAA